MLAKIASLAIVAATAMAFTPDSNAAPVNIDVRVAPPAPRYEVAPALRPGYVWTPGYWNWRANRYVWVNGAWARDRPGYVYTQPTWVNRDGRYHFVQGAWGRGDRDRDGVPNRVDRDRDGDGVPNRFDRHPNNGNRR